MKEHAYENRLASAEPASMEPRLTSGTTPAREHNALSDEEIIIAETYPDKAQQLRRLIWVAALLLFTGLLAPIITLSKFVLIQNTFSVLSGVIELLKEGQIFLFLVITGFSVVLPVLKLWVLYGLVSKRDVMQNRVKKQLHWMHLYGKWSMLDVFVVAVMVVAVKLGAIADVEMRFGLYAFAASVLLTMLITARIVGLTNHSGTPRRDRMH